MVICLFLFFLNKATNKLLLRSFIKELQLNLFNHSLWYNNFCCYKTLCSLSIIIITILNILPYIPKKIMVCKINVEIKLTNVKSQLLKSSKG